MIKAQGIMISSKCNLTCSYCNVNSLPFLERLQKEPLNLNPIADTVESLSLWGGEPSYGFEDIMQNWNIIEANFPKLKEISTSTNQTEPEKVIELMNFLVGKNIKLKVQLSDDSIFNENNRGVYPSFIKECTVKIVNSTPSDLNISFHWKPTISRHEITVLLDKLDQWADHFEDIYKELDIKSNITFEPAVPFSLACPGDYKKSDGEKLATLFKMIHNYKSKTVHIEETYTPRLKKLLDYKNDLYVKHHMFTCSAGDSYYHTDRKGLLHFCHRSYFFDYPEYIESLDKQEQIASKEFPIGKDINKLAMRGMHDFPEAKIASCLLQLRRLALNRDVLEECKDFEISYPLAVFLSTSVYCPAESFIQTGSWHTCPDSMAIIFGNGAFKEIARKAIYG